MKRTALYGLSLAISMTIPLLASCSNTGVANETTQSAATGSTASATSVVTTETSKAEGTRDFLVTSDKYPHDYIVKDGAEWELVTKVEGSGLIEGLNFDRNGQLWFIDVMMGKIHNVTDGVANTVYEDRGNAMPNGAKFIDDHTMLITDRAKGLCTYDIQTNEYKVLIPDFNGKAFNGLNDLVLDGQGGSYFTDPGQSDYLERAGQVFYVNYEADDPSIELIEDGFAYPNGITLSPDGKFIYVAEFNTNSIVCIPSAAYTEGRVTPYVVARLEGGHGPDGITVDSAGNIYIAHLEAKQVVVVDPFGFEIARLQMPEEANIYVDNLALHDGYLYVCEFGSGSIYRIQVNTETGEL